MSRERVLTDARLVLPDEVIHGTLALRGGQITAIDSALSSVSHAEHCDGDYLIPGLVELHTDHIETQAFPRPGVAWPMVPALLAHDAVIACAGITTVFDAIPLGHDAGKEYRRGLAQRVLAALDEATAADTLRAEHRVHLRCELAIAETIREFDSACTHPLLGLVSLMDHTPGQRQFVSLDKYREYYRGKYGLDAAEIEAHIADRLANQAEFAAPNRRHILGWAQDRSIALASHDDATTAHIAEASAGGITIAEFPTTLEAARSAHAAGLATVMGAPNVVRGGSHSGNVAAEDLAAADCLDALSSDYVPASLLQAAWALPRVGIDFPAAIRTVSDRPAAMAGLTDRGRLAEGHRADLVRVRALPHGPAVRRVWRGGAIIA